ncbi:hypothetical protein BHM03_00017574 [Ensete ventricosum]|nr:hypothetical protein BHM03_00017574 [Ensete ventricosum]
MVTLTISILPISRLFPCALPHRHEKETVPLHFRRIFIFLPANPLARQTLDRIQILWHRIRVLLVVLAALLKIAIAT